MTARKLATLATVALAIGSAGCSQLGNLGTILGQPSAGGGSGTVLAEVQSVNTNNQEIVIRTERGETGGVRFDNRTRVVYQNQEYPVTALERGDVVEMQVHDAGNGVYYTDQILVRQSVQERTGTRSSTGSGATGGDTALRILSGTVGGVDYERGIFELRTGGSSVTVTLPYNPRSTVSDRFRGLRSGEFVEIVGRFVTSTRFELERFQ